ncbi:MAG TPA: 1,4-dihydroxy-2-naphthoate polyprenyltransferase [Bacteroidia bacterium]|nr:1,4-dihydroxy-2-naphthoate polyprenyltransferase [Bacteroidia bacterium]
MNKARAWIVSLRLRTLPLALAATGMGNFLAVGFKVFNLQTCLLTSLTAVLLQILSNLANEYGDYKHGADNDERIGPQRSLQTGTISVSAMRNAVIFVALLTFVSGCILLYEAVDNFYTFLIFLVIGLLCIVAAIKYTMGKKPYGYSGLGDMAVFIFFGVVGVGGTFYLHAHYFELDILMPASTLGFLSAGVLNVNNMRDINTDAATGKRTLAVRLGLTNAKRYHFLLIVIAFSRLTRFTLLHMSSPWQWTFLITLPLFIWHLVGVMKSDSAGMDKYLKQLAIFTLLLVLCMGISICLNPYV